MQVDTTALYRVVGSRVRAARERAGVSQAALAGTLGMTRTSIVNIEAGRQRPPLHVIWAIADALRTEIALLLPTRTDYNRELPTAELDQETISQIETATAGDPSATRDLIAFVGKTKSAAKESK